MFSEYVKLLKIRIFADTTYILYMNGKKLGRGPVCPGGDYANTKPMPIQYYSEYTIDCPSKNVEFSVIVKLSPAAQCEMSCGRGGLWVEYEAIDADRKCEIFYTDESWETRVKTEYVDCYNIDFTKEKDVWNHAKFVEPVCSYGKSLRLWLGIL